MKFWDGQPFCAADALFHFNFREKTPCVNGSPETSLVAQRPHQVWEQLLVHFDVKLQGRTGKISQHALLPSTLDFSR
ncbi:hypothetical protein F1728_20630 [Gimesia benthica]|uniref:Uncharacterized protein n=1 Tax=Gimesia benthica TaxID=2608982 RepID=A0A6I6AIM0_9PLAN|nr:hypothetical protein [Gimesia benthica]QGQ24951.1 hypothetical protein F1728_20630 [Gimesia benthica]